MKSSGELIEYLVEQRNKYSCDMYENVCLRMRRFQVPVRQGTGVRNEYKQDVQSYRGASKTLANLNFTDLAFLFNAQNGHDTGFVEFIYNYEMSYLLYYKTRKNIKILTIFKDDKQNIGSVWENSKILLSLNQDFPAEGQNYFRSEGINAPSFDKALQIKSDYIYIKSRLNASEDVPKCYNIMNGDKSLIEAFMYPDSSILQEVQQRPSLCVYASIAHHYLPKDNFIREFMQACTAREDTIDARARAQARIGTANNWYDEPGEAEDLGPQLSGNGAEYSQNAFRIIRDTPHLHIITESVEPLFAALIACNKTTLEFKGQESSIDIEYLRDAVINGMWCGQVYDETDEHCHNLLTFLMLMLIGSSSGLPMYASRGWRVVSAVWKKMVQTIKTDTWLARYVDDGDVEIKEERLLELIIKVISITHMSDDPNDPVKGFQPGALGYIPYVENYYMRIKSKLGRVKTKAWTVDSGVSGETKSASTPGDGVPFRFARRVRFIEEFSFPADIDDIRDAVRFRFADILGIENRSKVRFV